MICLPKQQGPMDAKEADPAGPYYPLYWVKWFSARDTVHRPGNTLDFQSYPDRLCHEWKKSLCNGLHEFITSQGPIES